MTYKVAKTVCTRLDARTHRMGRMSDTELVEPYVHFKLDLCVVIENERELREYARSVAIARAHEFDGGDLEDELETIASGPAGAITIALDLLAYVDTLPGVTADGSTICAYDPYSAEQLDEIEFLS